MDKCARVDKSEQAVDWTAAAGIRVKGLFMLGYPGETPESIEMTKAFVRRIPMTIMNLTKFTPYPGSPVYRELYGTTIRDDHWEKMNGMNFVWAPDGISVEELDRHYQDVLGCFYRQKRVRQRTCRNRSTTPATWCGWRGRALASAWPRRGATCRAGAACSSIGMRRTST